MSRCLVLALLALVTVPGFARAELPPVRLSLVKDLNSEPDEYGSNPRRLFAHGGRAYFPAYVPFTGALLFESDGSPAGLRAIAAPDSSISWDNAEIFAAINGRLLLRAGVETQPRQFWAVPIGGGAPERLTDRPFWTGAPMPGTRVLATLPQRVLFELKEDGSVWSSDATAAGTRQLDAFPLASVGASCRIGDRAVIAGTVPGAAAIALSDGTAAGSQILASLPNLTTGEGYAVNAGGLCYFALQRPNYGGYLLWASDGTAAGTVELARQNEGQLSGMAVLGTSVYFTENRFTSARLQRVSLAEPQPVIVNEILSSGHHMSDLRVVAGRLVYFGSHGTPAGGNYGVFSSDGTTAGTQRVFPTATADAPLDISHPMTVIGSKVIVTGTNTQFLVDVTGAGVSTALPWERFDRLESVVIGDRRVGRGTSAYGVEVLSTDGTPEGTALLHDIWPSTKRGLGYPNPAVVIGDVLVYGGAVDQGDVPRDGLARTDGTQAGTYTLPRSAYNGGGVDAVERQGDSLVFSANYYFPAQGHVFRTDANFAAAMPLWQGPDVVARLQATGAGSILFSCGSGESSLCAIADTSAVAVPFTVSGSNLEQFTPVGSLNGKALMATSNGLLWWSDGTAPGTYLSSATAGSLIASQSPPAVVAGGKIFFFGCLQQSCGLVASDGSNAGTQLLRVLTATDSQDRLAAIGAVALLGRLQDGQFELWRSDGTAGGTELIDSRSASALRNPVVAGPHLHLLLEMGCTLCGSNVHLVSDGTAAGTRTLQLPAGTWSEGAQAALNDDTVLFACKSIQTGEEPCLSNAAGTEIRVLPEIRPGAFAGLSTFVGATGEAAYFAADDGLHGLELWQARILSDALFADGLE